MFSMWKNKHYSSESNNIISTKRIWTGQRLVRICTCYIIEVISHKMCWMWRAGQHFHKCTSFPEEKEIKQAQKTIAYLSLSISFAYTNMIFVQRTVYIQFAWLGKVNFISSLIWCAACLTRRERGDGFIPVKPSKPRRRDFLSLICLKT